MTEGLAPISCDALPPHVRPLADDERLVYDFCVQLTLNHRVPDALWREAVATWST